MTSRQPKVARRAMVHLMDDAERAVMNEDLPWQVYHEGGGSSPLLLAAFAGVNDAKEYANKHQTAAQREDKLDVYVLLGPEGEVEYWL